MGVRVYNSKTGASVTCDAKYWAECSDHGPKAGFALWTPAMTAGVNHIPVNNGNDLPLDDSTVTLNEYEDYDAMDKDDYEVGTCSECGEEDVEIYDTDNHTCVDCYDSEHGSNEEDGDWMDGDALASAGLGTDEDYGGYGGDDY